MSMKACGKLVGYLASNPCSALLAGMRTLDKPSDLNAYSAMRVAAVDSTDSHCSPSSLGFPFDDEVAKIARMACRGER
jgi:hypothetical protein